MCKSSNPSHRAISAALARWLVEINARSAPVPAALPTWEKRPSDRLGNMPSIAPFKGLLRPQTKHHDHIIGYELAASLWVEVSQRGEGASHPNP